MGESCSHIGALLFKIEAAVRAGFTTRACTDEACQWNVDFVSHVEGTPLARIKVYDAERVNKNREKRGGSSSEALQEKGLPEDKQDELLKKLAALDKKPIALHCFSQHCESFRPQIVPPARGKIPASLRNLHNSEYFFGDDEVTEKCHEVFHRMKISKEDADYLYQSTKKQSKSLVWKEVRIGRLTASVAHEVLHTNKENPSRSLIMKLTNPRDHEVNAPSVRWGKDNEKNGINDYSLLMSQEHNSFEVKECGLLLCHDASFIGATPDGIFSCKCFFFFYNK